MEVAPLISWLIIYTGQLLALLYALTHYCCCCCYGHKKYAIKWQGHGHKKWAIKWHGNDHKKLAVKMSRQ